MHDAVLVRVVEGLADLDGEIDHLAPGDGPPLFEDLVQGIPLDELHGDVGGPRRSPHRQEPDDVGMAELLEDLRLAHESFVDLPALGDLPAHDLDGRGLPGGIVDPSVDDPHRPRANDRVQPEGPQFLADSDLAHGRPLTSATRQA